jgi:hypothetical protein
MRVPARWTELRGKFALMLEEAKAATNSMQRAVSKDGGIRGNAHYRPTDATIPRVGQSTDKRLTSRYIQTQFRQFWRADRLPWTTQFPF